MAMQHKDVLGLLNAAATLLAGCRPGVGLCRLVVGRFWVLLCVCAHFSPAIHHLGAWPMPGLAPGLTEAVSQTALSLVKYLSGNHLTEIIGRPGSFRQISISGLRISQIGRFWGSF